MRNITLKFALALLMTSFSLQSIGQSREQDLAESFIKNFIAKYTNDPCKSDCPWNYASYWPQISKKHFIDHKKNPEKTSINYGGSNHTRWITNSTKPGYVEIITVDIPDRINQVDEGVTVGFRFNMYIKNIPGEGLRILPPLGGTSAWSTWDENAHTNVSKRDFISLGLEEKFTKLYGDGGSRNIRTTDSGNSNAKLMCEAQKKTCLASCGDPSYWNGRAFVDNQSWSGCNSKCNSISCY